MKEELLHYIWQQKILARYRLHTTEGLPVEIIRSGTLNRDAGPDFFDARIRIDGTLWAGNVEIHIKSSDWMRHRHHTDKAYHNVILHVVYDHDLEIGIPTLELKHHLTSDLILAYQNLITAAGKIPCEKIMSLPDPFIVDQFLHRLAIERLERKCGSLEQLLVSFGNDWEQLLYFTISKYFGMRVNAEPFLLLAQLLPYHLLARHRHNRLQTDCLVFGVAGFIPEKKDHSYTGKMYEEFIFLKSKYNLGVLPRTIWKFGRTRPANFPTIRLAQFAALWSSSGLWAKVLKALGPGDAGRLFNAAPSPGLDPDQFYPARHQAGIHPPGEQFVKNLLINAIIPLKFLYGKHQSQEHHCEQALVWLESLKAENNTLTKFWSRHGINARHALHSQSVIQLHNQYCAKQRCLQCAIGNHILYTHVK